jgi:hypothetical protein
MLSNECEVKRIQLNSAKAAYTGCLGPAAVASAALDEAATPLQRAEMQGAQLMVLNDLYLKQLKAAEDPNMDALTGLAVERIETLQAEIDGLKGDIRKQRRRFLDADPSSSPAVGGLYFLKVPDNKVIVGFLSAFGSFLLFASLLIVLGHVPFPPFSAMSADERYKTVGVMWGVSILLMYLAFFMFT